ncbi:MAG: hypothetical protein DMF63_13875 [Acidobacteria bacterium]|nr:MAG: hypothetical protein DMF63_13875 [Acidobacteriota bacterium]
MLSRNDLLIYAVIGIVAFCTFANSLGNDFVYDDTRQVLRNPMIQRSELYGTALTSDVWAFKGGGDVAASNYFRPTFVAWMIVNWKLFGSAAWGWHLTNILLHMAVCLLLFVFLRRMRCERFTAAAIAISFAVHPVHVENVAWISGVTDPLMSLFLFTSLILAQKYAEARSSMNRAIVFLILSVVTYLLAIGAKEVALFCAPLYWLIFRNTELEEKRSNASAVKTALLYLVAAVAFFIVRIRVLGALMIPVDDPVLGNHAFLSIPKIFLFYLRQIFFPISLGPAHPIRAADVGIIDVVIPVIVSALVLWILWILARRTEIQTFGLALFVLTLLPVMNPATFSNEQLVHDRYLYLPLAGMLIVVVPAIANWLGKKDFASRRLVAGTVFGIVVLALAAKSIAYNGVWSDGETLWRHAVAIDPGASHAWQNLAATTSNKQESLEASDRALQIRPSPGAAVAKARALIALGKFEEAVTAAKDAIASDPAQINAFSLFQAYEAQAFALVRLGRLDEAETSLRSARERLPIYHAALTEKLAVVLYTQNRKPETLAELEAVRDKARNEYLNDSKTVFLRLGMLYAEQGRKNDAKAALEEYLSSTADVQDAALVGERRQATELLRRVSSK